MDRHMKDILIISDIEILTIISGDNVKEMDIDINFVEDHFEVNFKNGKVMFDFWEHIHQIYYVVKGNNYDLDKIYYFLIILLIFHDMYFNMDSEQNLILYGIGMKVLKVVISEVKHKIHGEDIILGSKVD